MKQKNFKLTKILQSILAGLLGVQSSKNSQKDFEEGKLQHYIIAGVVALILIIASLRALVLYVSSEI